MGSHQSARAITESWITPPWIIEALGAFDFDPCTCETQPWPTAAQMVSPPACGLSVDWSGRVWLNPPYGRETGKWLRRLALHGTGTALIFARTETDDWHEWVWAHASAILFLHGRLFFHRPDGQRAPHNAGAPSALIAYGDADADALRSSGLRGAFVDLRSQRSAA